eukprot:gnl/TRDRNA2_/TRDRNA2_189400_c0_seq1.p1 gnl/TRDRNA2_/TRDRNA2_189400_c0~~gnl/TRDRNA2_/TRDRNA2_189400_c0_seq1.p1  ORF type:complete len:137 (+),score=36.94 gnl/TRDRNA2_/TRDRNA2_189400_c0_seq1:104-514(+)
MYVNQAEQADHHDATMEKVRRHIHEEFGRELHYMKSLVNAMEELWLKSAPPGITELPPLLRDQRAKVGDESAAAEPVADAAGGEPMQPGTETSSAAVPTSPQPESAGDAQPQEQTGMSSRPFHPAPSSSTSSAQAS